MGTSYGRIIEKLDKAKDMFVSGKCHIVLQWSGIEANPWTTLYLVIPYSENNFIDLGYGMDHKKGSSYIFSSTLHCRDWTKGHPLNKVLKYVKTGSVLSSSVKVNHEVIGVIPCKVSYKFNDKIADIIKLDIGNNAITKKTLLFKAGDKAHDYTEYHIDGKSFKIDLDKLEK